MRLIVIALCVGCVPKIVRHADTVHVETLAALARQKEAELALFAAAAEAKARGDRGACILYAEPAILIEAYAEAQAMRSLWLAGLIDGEDPGPSRETRDIMEVCSGE